MLPVKGTAQTVKTYAKSDLRDYYVNLPAGADRKDVKSLYLSAGKRDAGFGFTPRTVANTDPDYPLDSPPVVLEGSLVRKDSSPVPVTLVPMGGEECGVATRNLPYWNSAAADDERFRGPESQAVRRC